jgi:hypothetical protein
MPATGLHEVRSYKAVVFIFTFLGPQISNTRLWIGQKGRASILDRGKIFLFSIVFNGL